LSLKATLIALVLALVLALPGVASAQLLDPTVDQYAPSTQQIDKQVNGGGGGGQDPQGGGGGEVPQGGGGGEVPQGGSGDQLPQGGGGGGQVPQGGGGGEVSQGGGNGEASPGGAGGQKGGGGAEIPAPAEGNGLNDRVVGGVPFTGFDLIALAVAAAVIGGTALLLRRLSRRPEPGM
jgi:hypothetical protein